jgi:hypothetical protein
MGLLLLIVVIGFFCLLMALGGAGWLWALAGFGIFGFLLLLAFLPKPSGGTGSREMRVRGAAGREDLDELDDFMDMQDDV